MHLTVLSLVSWLGAVSAWLTAVLAGIMTFFISQYNLKNVIEPEQEFNKLRGRIAATILIHARAYSSMANDEIQTSAKSELRSLAGELRGAIEVLPKRERKPEYHEAVKHLVALSNMVGMDDKEFRTGKIVNSLEKCLSIQSMESLPVVKQIKGK